MRLVISDEARRDLESIARFGTMQFGAVQALAYAARIERAMQTICATPKMAPIRKSGRGICHILTVESHLIAYEVREQEVLVLRVLHGHQNWIEHL
jgi:toxin ParE1/3/4